MHVHSFVLRTLVSMDVVTFTHSVGQQRRLKTIYDALSNGHTFYDRHGKKIFIMKLIIEEAKDQVDALQSKPPTSWGIKKQRYNPYLNCKSSEKYLKFIDQ